MATVDMIMRLCVRGSIVRVVLLVVALCVLTSSCTSVDTQPRLESLAAPLVDQKHTSTDAYRNALHTLESRLKNAKSPDPFILEEQTFEFGWCQRPPSRNSTLKDLTTRLELQSAIARDFAQLYAITNSEEAYQKAIDHILSWAQHASLFNTYEQGMDPATASFPGVERGFCNRSWNMMLDSIWQTYGLINFSEAYSILKHSGLSTSYSIELETIRSWLKTKLVPAVNSGLHAWTKYADLNPRSAAYIRYRSDNHISWSLAGLATAGVALNDKHLLDYVYYGTAYDDGISGMYENPSSLIKFIPYAIKPSGEVFDEAERSRQHKGFFYGNFSLWALIVAAINTDKAGYPPIWETQMTETSGTVAGALDRYAPYVANISPIIDTEEKTKPEFFSFIYRLIAPMEWVQGERKSLYIKAAQAPYPQVVRQGLGSIDLISISPENFENN